MKPMKLDHSSTHPRFLSFRQLIQDSYPYFPAIPLRQTAHPHRKFSSTYWVHLRGRLGMVTIMNMTLSPCIFSPILLYIISIPLLSSRSIHLHFRRVFSVQDVHGAAKQTSVPTWDYIINAGLVRTRDKLAKKTHGCTDYAFADALRGLN